VSSDHGSSSIPRGILIGAGALIGATLLMVTLVRAGVIDLRPDPETAVRERLVLQFEDRADGSVTVRDVNADLVLTVLGPGEGGFTRGVLRALVRERRQHEIGKAQPFALTYWENGRLSLEDLSTGRRVDVGAFGPTQVDAFARLLVAGGAGG
jgi:putative photosynthetic complex assembly protein